jgi:hypothetical protein
MTHEIQYIVTNDNLYYLASPETQTAFDNQLGYNNKNSFGLFHLFLSLAHLFLFYFCIFMMVSIRSVHLFFILVISMTIYCALLLSRL